MIYMEYHINGNFFFSVDRLYMNNRKGAKQRTSLSLSFRWKIRKMPLQNSICFKQQIDGYRYANFEIAFILVVHILSNHNKQAESYEEYSNFSYSHFKVT